MPSKHFIGLYSGPHPLTNGSIRHVVQEPSAHIDGFDCFNYSDNCSACHITSVRQDHLKVTSIHHWDVSLRWVIEPDIYLKTRASTGGSNGTRLPCNWSFKHANAINAIPECLLMYRNIAVEGHSFLKLVKAL